MEQKVAPPRAPFERETVREPKHYECADGPEVRVYELLRGGVAPSRGLLAEQVRVVELAREEERERSPRAEDRCDERPAAAPQPHAAPRLRRESAHLQSLNVRHLLRASLSSSNDTAARAARLRPSVVSTGL